MKILLPDSCRVGRVLHKTDFARNLRLTSAMQKAMTDDISGMEWAFKIAPSTLAVASGTEVREIVLFRLELKHADISDTLLRAFDEQMPRHVVFLLEYEGNCRCLMHAKQGIARAKEAPFFRVQETYLSPWVPPNSAPAFTPHGRDMDALHDSLLRAIAGDDLLHFPGASLAEDVARTQELRALQKQAATLQKQLRTASQPRRQYELHRQLLSLQSKIQALAPS